MKTRFLRLSRRQKQLIAAFADSVFLPLIFFLSLILHYDGFNAERMTAQLWLGALAAVVGVAIFARLGLYRAVIRYIDHRIMVAGIVGSAMATVVLALVAQLAGPRLQSITPFVIYWLLSIGYLVVSRLSARRYFLRQPNNSRRVRVAIYGAGEAGSLLANAVAPGEEYEPVLFLDDNPQRHNTTVRGMTVYPSTDLEQLAKRYNISTVMLAMPSITRQQQRKILDRLAGLSLKIMVTPSIGSMVSGKSRVSDVRQIEIEDLLSRHVVAPNPDLLSSCITGKSVLVSGAGGSIGSELCRQIVALRPRRLALLDISEYALYTIEQELRGLIASDELDVELVPLLGSVLDTDRCTRILRHYQADTVYHAAAYKHVPLVEHNPIEGIRNNAFGTLSLARAAEAAGVECFVLVSTDKAVRPTNVMGATKRLAELILQAFARRQSPTRFCMVRFGNVLGSSGSVVPLFRRQIASGGPLTLTHPDITRYFMTIPEAAQLVVQAGAMSRGGDVFVLDMGEPVRIADLAARMVHLTGQEVKSPDAPDGIEIQYVGLRPGEKLYEELLIGSNVTGTEHPLIRRAQEAEMEWGFLKRLLDELDLACTRVDHDAIRALLCKLVSEYQPEPAIVDHLWLQATPPSASAAATPAPPEQPNQRQPGAAIALSL